jgi:glycosyltransferase involved in cell wall biosynthesis
MQASVVIPTHNRESLLSRVVGYYAGQVDVPGDFELVIVDDGSEDDTHQLFTGLTDVTIENRETLTAGHREIITIARKGWYRPEDPNNLFIPESSVYVRYIKIRKSGRSTARNVGIGFSAYPLIIFADDDIFVESEFIKKHMEAHSPDDRLVVMGKVIHTGNLEDPFSARWKLKDINTAFLATGNASVLKRYLVEAGLFDEWYRVYGWEDFDLGIHLHELGLRSEKQRVYGYHYDPSQKSAGRREALSPRSVYEKEWERGLSAVYFYTHHPLSWVKRFTLVENRFLMGLVNLLGWNNWFLKKEKLRLHSGLFKLLVRYKGYFDGVEEGLRKAEKWETGT